MRGANGIRKIVLLLGSATVMSCTDGVTPAGVGDARLDVPASMRLESGSNVTVGLVDHSGRSLGTQAAEGYRYTWISADPNVVSVQGSGRSVVLEPVTIGETDIRVTATPIDADGGTVNAVIHVTSSRFRSLSAASGNNQTGVVGRMLPDSLGVRVVNAAGNPVGDFLVTFRVTAGGGVLSDDRARTSSDGWLRVAYTLGTAVGTNTVLASSNAGSVQFDANAINGPAAQIEAISGDGQQGTTGALLPNPLIVRVADEFGNPVPAAPVTSSVESGGGYTTPETTLTDGTGQASTNWRLGPTAGPQRARAEVAGVTATTFTATAAASTEPTITRIELGPSSWTLSPGEGQYFIARATMSDGSTTDTPPVIWTATGGTFSFPGFYVAGQINGTYRVVATAPNAVADTAVITITGGTLTITSVTLTPSSTSLETGQMQQFTVSAAMSDGSTQSNPGVTWSATGGTINTSGLFTAGQAAGTYRVVATAANGVADTAGVTINAPAGPTITRIELGPSAWTLAPGEGQYFIARATMSDGSTTDTPPVTWTATGGTFSFPGFYVAGQTSGTFRVVATASNGVADTAVVTITGGTASIASLTLTPGSASLQAGQPQQFTVSATMSDGSTQSNPSVTWTATGGTISSSGAYTAGSTAGTFRAIVSGGGKADTAVITIAAATITSLVMTPSSASLQTAQTQQFTVSATLSNGGTQSNPSVTWTATGGTISTSGLYTAGSTAGAFRAIVSGSGRADTAAITITTPPPPSGGNNMFFNSSEAGCGSDANVLLCDDFEDGVWYSKNCDQANSSGGLLQTDGWCGTIYRDDLLAAGTARCGGVGFRSACAATTGSFSGAGNMADHALAQGVNEVWLRFYTKPLSGYVFGAEKVLTFNDGNPGDAGIKWGNLSWNCARNASSTGEITMGFPVPMDECETQNVSNNITIQSGNWYFYEVHYKLSDPGQSNGVFELWVDNCGASGTACPATPTLRMRRTDVRNDRTSTSQLIRVLWFESWSNPSSSGERLWDQIKVSKGPIGFMQ